MSIEKALIYPFDKDFIPILRYKKFINRYDIISVVSPRGWGFGGKDVGLIDGGMALDILVKDDLEKSIDECETLIFTEGIEKLDFNSFVYPRIVKCIEKRKNIVFLSDIEEETLNILKEMCATKNVYCKVECGLNNSNYCYMGKIQKIRTPVVFVLGESERTNKFEIEMSLTDSLGNMGYKVSCVGSKSSSTILDVHAFPKFMYEGNLKESEKIIRFNNYIKNIESQEEPDIIIIGVPGAILKLTDEEPNDFGVLAFEVSQALKPDFAILSVLYEDYKKNFFELLKQQVKYRFGIEVDCFNLSNTQVDWDVLRNLKRVAFINLNNKIINEKVDELKSSEVEIVNINNDSAKTYLTELLVDKLYCEEYEII